MSGSAPSGKGVTTRVVQASALVVVFGVLLAATRLAPEARTVVGTVAGLGFLLLAGTLTSELAEIVGLPHLCAYIAAGLVAGPHVLMLVDHDTVERMSPVNGLALALIAMAGGAALKVELVKNASRSLAWATGLQIGAVFSVTFVTFILLARFTPFWGLEMGALVGVAIVWAVLATSRSPAALLGVFAQLKPRGPLTTFSLAFVMLSDLVVILMMSVALALVRPLLIAGTELSFAGVEDVGRDVLGSVALGVTLGIILSLYLRLIGKHLLVVLLLVGVALSELLKYIQLDTMLAFLVAGMVVANFSDQGEKLLTAIDQTGVLVFVIFFALAGAQLDLPVLVELWPVALALAVIRGVTTYGAGIVSGRIVGDAPPVRGWGWSALVSQAGLTLGLSAVVVRAYPVIGESFRALSIAVVAINEIIGPIIFKVALDRAGESYKGEVDQEGGETAVSDGA